MSAKKPASVIVPNKKAAPKIAPSHPTWIDMIKECIVAHPEYARQGVSRPQIKEFVESTYKLSIGPFQNTQLSKALKTGSTMNIFVLPKGPSERVKLAPRLNAAEASVHFTNFLICLLIVHTRTSRRKQPSERSPLASTPPKRPPLPSNRSLRPL
ncbi:hypothetical protein B0H13DRAFT_1941331 [Mycena leptocephala]|nr:hypothetical protein B0H13DRAFT_1941331 [Mycena leptocephala]